MKSRINRLVLAVLFVGVAWWFASTFFRKNWDWLPSLVLGAIAVLVFAYFGRWLVAKPAPFQLVLRLANEEGGDIEDDQIFKALHDRFKLHFPRSANIRFDGFDTDGSFIWFYFLGSDEILVRHAVLSELDGFRIRQGSYFLSQATQAFAAPNDGLAMLLGNSRLTEKPPSVS